VSTKRQVDNSGENDISMQHTACHEFASRNGWTITREFYEKGISGYKISAEDRDSMKDLKEAAEKDEFDILLVYMFDRIGRKEDETPIVVKWFASNGVEVWSVTEGEQRFDTHADNLINFVRFWQADGESQKTSMRVKESMNQMTERGEYTGGVTPFGYMTTPSGNFNKRGKERLELVVDHTEAPIVRMIFDKTVRDGYGSHRLATMLNEQGIKTHNGSGFQCNTVNRILSNRMYIGYYKSGDMFQPHQSQLQIVDEHTFSKAQKILAERSTKNEEKTQMARNTKGKTLLSGNIYCGHCGSLMNATSCLDRYTRKDGSVYEKRRQQYICSKKGRNSKACEGQAVYASKKIDEVVKAIVEEHFDMIEKTPKSHALEKRYQIEVAELKVQERDVSQEKKNLQESLASLTAEISKSLTGDSKFTPDTLSMAINNTQSDLQKADDRLVQLNFEINNSQGAIKNLGTYYDQFRKWAVEFNDETPEGRKMIVCHLVREVKVSRGYDLDVTLDMNYRQFLAEIPL